MEQNVRSSKWVFKNKLNSDGSLAKRKARIMANGMWQHDGLDYDQTFFLIIKLVSMRLILSLTVHHDWKLHQLDVSNAFLHGFLEEDVCMKQPIGLLAKNI